jgi:hypothetical protein
MTNPIKRLNQRQQVSLAIWVLNITICVALLVFVLR